IIGYVIMPNHCHILLYQNLRSEKTINDKVSNGKRFLAYEIVKRLKDKKNFDLLEKLSSDLTTLERSKGSKHKIFKTSFDAKICSSIAMLETKLNYIHHNPTTGKWNLSESFCAYKYSSAPYYELDKPNKYITHYLNINDTHS
ncbi:MAG: hypothetical protein WBA74_04060, partial [Cyclobacteriaceae bacterium]